MHPKWQEKIYRFTQSLFIDEDIQKSQIFMATHSDHVLKSALEDDNALIIKLINDSSDGLQAEYLHKDSSGEILPSITLGEVKWRVFNMPTIDFHIELYSYIQEHLAVDGNGNNFLDVHGNLTSANIKETDGYLCRKGNATKLSGFKNRQGKTQNYSGITTYIRNCIDHPNNGTFSEQELSESIKFMITLI